MYYGQSKEEVRLYNIIRRLENNEIISDDELNFVERKLRERKDRKLWNGIDLFKDGIERAIKRLKDGNRKNFNGEERPQENEDVELRQKQAVKKTSKESCSKERTW